MTWINVKDRLPEGVVLVTDLKNVGTSYCIQNYCNSGENIWGESQSSVKLHKIKYWMELPIPPEK